MSGAPACLLLAALLTVPVKMRGQSATLVGDAQVSSAQPTVNAGSLSNLNVGGGYTTLLQFDLGVLPAGTTTAQITRATLRVYCNRADVSGPVDVQAVGGVWNESTVMYVTTPSLGPVVATQTVSTAGSFVTFDVTATVQSWVSGTTNYGLALTADASGAAQLQFDSKENPETAHEPQLEIALAGTSTPGATGPQGRRVQPGPQDQPDLPGRRVPSGSRASRASRARKGRRAWPVSQDPPDRKELRAPSGHRGRSALQDPAGQPEPLAPPVRPGQRG